MEYGEKISRLRKMHGMTQEDLGKILNVTYQAVSKWERGESLPDFATMSQIAKYFQVPLSYFEEGGELPEESATANDIAEKPVYLGACTGCGKMVTKDDAFSTSPRIVCKSCAEKQSQAATETAQNSTYIGVCTACGKMVTEDAAFSTSPRIVCKSCAQRHYQQEAEKKKQDEQNAKWKRERERAEVRGGGFDLKLIISLALALACMVLCMVMCYTNTSDREMYAFFLFVAPLIVFGLVLSVFDFIDMLRDKDDGPEGYNLPLSLIVGGAFALVYIALFLVLYFTSNNSGYYLVIMAAAAILSFTFVSQYMWGSIIPEIFSCGGFTFKLPGFIFSLTVDSILWMIVTKIFLGILSIILYVVTTILFALVAIVGSIFTFIPCIIFKVVRDKTA